VAQTEIGCRDQFAARPGDHREPDQLPERPVLIIAGCLGVSIYPKIGNFPMLPKTETQTDTHQLNQFLTEVVEKQGLGGLIALGLGVLAKLAAPPSLDPNHLIELPALAERWGWKDLVSFEKALEKEGIPTYKIGLRSVKLVRIRDLANKFPQEKVDE